MYPQHANVPFPPADLLEGRRGRPGAGLRLRVLMQRRRLDEMLMSGLARYASAELALRARQLTSRRRRVALADSIDEVMQIAERRGTHLSAVAPLAREVHASRPALLELELALRSDEEVEPAGVLLAQRLLTDGVGPLYFDCGDDALWRAVRTATAALQGTRAGAARGVSAPLSRRCSG